VLLSSDFDQTLKSKHILAELPQLKFMKIWAGKSHSSK